MDSNDYLKKILESQTLSEDGEELKALRAHREFIEKLLRAGFEECSPTIKYGGSKAKGTMIRESYDLDIICYFPHEDTAAGKSLKEIYDNVHNLLKEKYLTEPKASAIRLKDSNPKNYAKDFHIDVVPGRYTDDSETDVFLYQSSGEKGRLKTNLDTHISHVKDSGVRDAIRLLKLWKVRNGLIIRTFVLALLAIDVLKTKKKSPISEQLVYFWGQLKTNADDLTVEDPANPTGNDLSEFLDETVRFNISSVASATLQIIEKSGWEKVFGSCKSPTNDEKIRSLHHMVAAVPKPSKPWCFDG